MICGADPCHSPQEGSRECIGACHRGEATASVTEAESPSIQPGPNEASGDLPRIATEERTSWMGSFVPEREGGAFTVQLLHGRKYP